VNKKDKLYLISWPVRTMRQNNMKMQTKFIRSY